MNLVKAPRPLFSPRQQWPDALSASGNGSTMAAAPPMPLGNIHYEDYDMSNFQLLAFFSSLPTSHRVIILAGWTAEPELTVHEVLMHYAEEEAAIAAAESGADREYGYDSAAYLEHWAQQFDPAKNKG